jgi:hypothetical protein
VVTSTPSVKSNNVGRITRSKSTRNKMVANWSLAKEVAEITGFNIKDCRKAAKELMNRGVNSDNIYLLQDPKSVVLDCFVDGETRDMVICGDHECDRIDFEDFAIEGASRGKGMRRTNFKYSLVQQMAELSKEHGYENVVEALKLYRELTKDL